MDVPKKDINKYLKKITEKVAAGPTGMASESLFEAVCLFILAGKPTLAAPGLKALLTSELAIKKGSALYHPLHKIIFPSFYNAHDLSAFDLAATQFENEQELRIYCQNRKEALRQHMLIGQQGTLRPDEDSVAQLLERLDKNVKRVSSQDHSTWQITVNDLKNLSDFIQAYTIREELEKALQLVNEYVAIYRQMDWPGTDSISENVFLLGIDLAFRINKPAEGTALLQRWYLKSDRLVLPDLSFHTLVMLPKVMKALLDGALATEINLADESVVEFTAVLQRRLDLDLPTAAFSSIEERFDWHALLSKWEERILTDLKQDDDRRQLCSTYFPKVLETNRCKTSSASESQIGELETKLDIKLPQSYRAFLQYSNGWFDVESFIKFLNTDEIDWFSTENQEWIDLWSESTIEISDEKYFQYGAHQDPVNLRAEYLRTALQISNVEEGTVFLLNPKVIDDSGEWEAWEFGTSIPGAYRYRSFWELMQAKSKSSLSARH